MNNIFCLKNEIVVITGGSSGLGSHYISYFLNEGAKVINLDKNKLDTKEVNQKKNFYSFIIDITNKEALRKVVDRIITKIGCPSVLINNAGLDSPPNASVEENGPFETFPEESWDKVIDANLKGVFLCCQIIGGEMKKNKGGSIINISSIYGMLSPDQNLYEYRRKTGENYFKPVAYSVSKSGLYNLTRYLSVYWAKSSIRVNTLTISGVFNNQDKEFIDAYSKRIPIGRMANPSDFFGALNFLSSSASKYMTGSNLVVDGGWSSI